MTETTCPGCRAKGSIVEKDRQLVERVVLGIDEYGELSYGEPEVVDSTPTLECSECYRDTDQWELYGLTYMGE